MAYDSYAALQTEIITWMIRTGDTEFAAAVPGFITLAESMLNHGSESISALRCREMEASASIVITDGEGALPAGYLEFREVKGATGRVLTPTVTNSADYAYEFQTAGVPSEFAIVGSTIRTYPASSETISLRYYTTIPALSDSNTSNWLLVKYPSIYLLGSLMFACHFQGDDQRASGFGSLLQQTMGGLAVSDFRSKMIRANRRTSGPTP